MHFSYKERILLSFTAATIMLMAVAFSGYVSFKEMARQKKSVEHTYEVIGVLQDIMSGLRDIQSSQRGYVITGYEDYLAPYYIALPKTDDKVKILGELISDNPVQIKRCEDLKIHVKGRIDIAAQVIDAYQSQGQTASFDLIKKGSGKKEMDQIRAIVSDMTMEEERLLNLRRTAMERSLLVTTYTGVGGLITCFMILTAVFLLINREAQRRANTEDSLTKALKEMEMLGLETQIIGRMGDYLRGCRDDKEAYVMIEKTMPQIFPGTYGSISIFNNSRNLLQLALSWGESANIVTDFEPEACWALRQGRIHRYAANTSVPACGHIVSVNDGMTYICYSMQANGETIGQIMIGCDHSDVIGDHQVVTLRTVGEQISLALSNIQLQRALREQSIKDPLTKLFNRRYLEETLARELARSKRNDQSLCILMMDIDHFKKVNDTYGHDGGDAVLVAFANLLTQKMRKEDIACRLGGEEFVMVLTPSSLEQAKIRAAEINELTRAMAVKFQNMTIKITVSIGIAQYPSHGETGEELIRNADQSLYEAKHGGRDRFSVFQRV